MNKNPFIPQSSYTPQQPPLPPGPPPPQPGQPDYSAYWAAAQQTQPHPIPPYNQQWNTPPPPRPTPEQNALYANYGYGPQNQWQRQQHAQQQYHAAPPPPVPHGPPPPAQAYNPYQPGVYPQPYAPQAPQAMTQPPYPQPPQPPSQPIFNPHIPPQPVQMMQQQHQPRHGHHSSPQHQPPAKRQRFDGPGHHQPQQRQPPTQPNFQNQPPSQPMSFNNRGGAPGSNQPGGGGRGGAGGPRGGGNPGRGRGGSMNASRGNLAGRSGRGGSFNAGSGGNSGRGGSAGPLRGHGSRGHLGGNKDFHNRRGGSSFNSSGSFSHQNSSSFRGRGQGHSSNRSQRHDGNTSNNFSKDATMPSSSLSSSTGKKDENRRTLTDFKIVGLEIRDLSWTWGVLSSHKPASIDVKVEDSDESVIKQEHDDDVSKISEDVKSEHEGESGLANSVSKDQKPIVGDDSSSQIAGSSGNTPQSRIRVYFHTPVTADDSHPITHSFSVGSVGSAPSDSRKGKRKKLDDEDDEDGGGRRKIPPPTHAHASDEISSVAGSAAETASEADWLMAAITEGEENRGHGESETQRDPDAEETQRIGDDEDDGDDNERLLVREIIEPHENGDDGDTDGLYPDGDTYTDHVSQGNDDVDMSGSTDQVGDKKRNDAVVSTTSQVGNISAEADTTEEKDVTAATNSAGADHPVSSSVSNAQAAAGRVEDVNATQVDASLKTLPMPSGSQTEADTSISTEIDSVNLSNSLPGSFTAARDVSSGDLGVNSSVEHLPEPPASPVSVSNTLLSTSSSSTYGDSSQQSVSQLVNTGNKKTTRTPSANRLSISYAGGNRRLVIDAEVVETMNVYRSDGRIEVRMKLQQDADGGLKGILVESLSEVTKSYVPFEEIASSTSSDPSLPPFVTASLPITVTLIAHLDTERPLSEPRWVKTGDIPDWLRSMFGRMFWVAGDAAEGWEKKITVVDPDPPPTIWTVLEGWAQNSPVGIPTERQRFLKTHLSETENILEILLRLVRGERATAFSSSQTISAPSVSGPLLAALSQNTSHGAQQTHVSLAVMAIFQMTLEYAEKAIGEKGATEVEVRIGEIIRCLPSHLIYKSLDGIFKEWRVEKKGR